MLCAACACARHIPLALVSWGNDFAGVHVNALADGACSPVPTTLSGFCQVQMVAAAQLDDDAAELAAIAAQRNERYRAAQFRKRSGGFFTVHRGRGCNPNSVAYGLATAATATYVCKTDGCLALVDAGRARASAVTAQRTGFHCSDGCASKICASRFRAARFKSRQLAMATALDNGSRWLANWPAGIGHGVGQRQGSTAVRLAAAAARQRLDL